MKSIKFLDYSCIWTKMDKNVCITTRWFQNQILCPKNFQIKAITAKTFNSNFQTCLCLPKMITLRVWLPVMAKSIWMSKHVQIRCSDVPTMAKNVWMHPKWLNQMFIHACDGQRWLNWNVGVWLWCTCDCQKCSNQVFKMIPNVIETNIWMLL